MRAATFPDSECVAVTWLAAHPALDSATGTDLIGWAAGERRIVVKRIGGVPSLAIRIDNPRLDVHVYAETKAAAHDLAQTARALLHELPTANPEDLAAAVADVRDDVGITWLPDPDTQAPRYVFTVRLAVTPYP